MTYLNIQTSVPKISKTLRYSLKIIESWQAHLQKCETNKQSNCLLWSRMWNDNILKQKYPDWKYQKIWKRNTHVQNVPQCSEAEALSANCNSDEMRDDSMVFQSSTISAAQPTLPALEHLVSTLVENSSHITRFSDDVSSLTSHN